MQYENQEQFKINTQLKSEDSVFYSKCGKESTLQSLRKKEFIDPKTTKDIYITKLNEKFNKNTLLQYFCLKENYKKENEEIMNVFIKDNMYKIYQNVKNFENKDMNISQLVKDMKINQLVKDNLSKITRIVKVFDNILFEYNTKITPFSEIFTFNINLIKNTYKIEILRHEFNNIGEELLKIDDGIHERDKFMEKKQTELNEAERLIFSYNKYIEKKLKNKGSDVPQTLRDKINKYYTYTDIVVDFDSTNLKKVINLYILLLPMFGVSIIILVIIEIFAKYFIKNVIEINKKELLEYLTKIFKKKITEDLLPIDFEDVCNQIWVTYDAQFKQKYELDDTNKYLENMLLFKFINFKNNDNNEKIIRYKQSFEQGKPSLFEQLPTMIVNTDDTDMYTLLHWPLELVYMSYRLNDTRMLTKICCFLISMIYASCHELGHLIDGEIRKKFNDIIDYPVMEHSNDANKIIFKQVAMKYDINESDFEKWYNDANSFITGLVLQIPDCRNFNKGECPRYVINNTGNESIPDIISFYFINKFLNQIESLNTIDMNKVIQSMYIGLCGAPTEGPHADSMIRTNYILNFIDRKYIKYLTDYLNDVKIPVVAIENFLFKDKDDDKDKIQVDAIDKFKDEDQDKIQDEDQDKTQEIILNGGSLNNNKKIEILYNTYDKYLKLFFGRYNNVANSNKYKKKYIKYKQKYLLAHKK